MSNQDSIDMTKSHTQKMGEALAELDRNPSFKFLIREGYLRDKMLASASLLAVPQIKEKGQRTEVFEDIIAASNLQYWLLMVERQYEAEMNPTLSDDEELELQASEGGVK